LQGREDGRAVELQEAFVERTDHCVNGVHELWVNNEFFRALKTDARGFDVLEPRLLGIDAFVWGVGIRGRGLRL
jgi:hypothetical protein